ncbi:copper chaperone PCu(A)C [Nocardiopsis kunsanensis]|uniref:Copper chaperone PCu(A)C n=1 Tax=Nocardiopsis kunsanensis TaxID=141693 RepID=A0A918XB62_9ACTN|nr:copper chaperone PCu(A)C [Nocardiopsis kunsanensis]GHD22925.1 hypothetical protein GCM10007147_17760 [Nocardiopsis kunsanensis]
MSVEARNARWGWEKVGATAYVYMELRNTGGRTLSLVSASSPDFTFANLVTTTDEEGERVKAGLDGITVREETVLRPGDRRVQLDAPTRPLAADEAVELVLSMSDGTRLAITAEGETAPS